MNLYRTLFCFFSGWKRRLFSWFFQINPLGSWFSSSFPVVGFLEVCNLNLPLAGDSHGWLGQHLPSSYFLDLQCSLFQLEHFDEPGFYAKDLLFQSGKNVGIGSRGYIFRPLLSQYDGGVLINPRFRLNMDQASVATCSQIS